MIRTMTFAASSLMAAAAYAHPGHGAADPHVHTETLLALAIAGGIAFLAYRAWRSR